MLTSSCPQLKWHSTSRPNCHALGNQSHFGRGSLNGLTYIGDPGIPHFRSRLRIQIHSRIWARRAACQQNIHCGGIARGGKSAGSATRACAAAARSTAQPYQPPGKDRHSSRSAPLTVEKPQSCTGAASAHDPTGPACAEKAHRHQTHQSRQTPAPGQQASAQSDEVGAAQTNLGLVP